MATKDRSKQKEKFKANAKQQAAQERMPRTHLVPVPTWQSNENLDLQGNLLEVMERKLLEAMDAIQQLGNVMSIIMQQNVKSEKIKIDYMWNNGDKPSEAEVNAFKAEMERVKNQQKLMVDQSKLQENFAKTGLTDAEGNPIATTQNLDEDQPNSDGQPSENASESEQEAAE
jgi:hypothetical protein